MDQYTLAAKPIEMFFTGQSLAAGTAFIWRDGADAFLITNWHNVSGRDPWTREHLCLRTAAEPNELVIYLDDADQPGMRKRTTLRLYDEDDTPKWFEHPKLGHRVDVVALPLPDLPGFSLHPINEMVTEKLPVRVGIDVFVLGYPFGTSRSLLPIWKRASIASEPELAIDDLPYFYIDTASRKGMSGSPVIVRSVGAPFLEGGELVVTADPATRFLGVYTGRIGSNNEEKAQLGIVWRAEVVTEVIKGRHAGSAR